jgi:protein ImuB
MVETGRPTRDAAALMRLYRERLDSLADPLDPGFGFDLMRLSVLVAEPLGALQPSLDGRAVEEEAVADLVDRLVVRLGRERVIRFAARDSHDPDRESRMLPAARRAGQKLGHPADKRDRPPAWPVPDLEEPPTRPLQLFDPPQPIETLAEVPDGPPLRFRWRRLLFEVARAEGPERIAREWWREDGRERTRDYFRVEDKTGRRFWLFRQGLYGRDEGEPRWFLHGVFA